MDFYNLNGSATYTNLKGNHFRKKYLWFKKVMTLTAP